MITEVGWTVGSDFGEDKEDVGVASVDIKGKNNLGGFSPIGGKTIVFTKEIFVYEIRAFQESRQYYTSASEFKVGKIRRSDISRLQLGQDYHDERPSILIRGDAALLFIGPVRGVVTSQVSTVIRTSLSIRHNFDLFHIAFPYTDPHESSQFPYFAS